MTDKVIDITDRLPYTAGPGKVNEARARVNEALDKYGDCVWDASRDRRTRGEMQIARDAISARLDAFEKSVRIEVLSQAINASLKRADDTLDNLRTIDEKLRALGVDDPGPLRDAEKMVKDMHDEAEGIL